MLTEKLEFMTDLGNQNCMWMMVRHLKKVSYNQGDYVYKNGELSEILYMINNGIVKYMEGNGWSFAEFRVGKYFGDCELFSGLQRIGSALAITDLKLYKLEKEHIEQVLSDFPLIKHNLQKKAINDSRRLLSAKLAVSKKMPLYGQA